MGTGTIHILYNSLLAANLLQFCSLIITFLTANQCEHLGPTCVIQGRLRINSTWLRPKLKDETGAKMISATRRIFYMQNLKPSELDVVTFVFDETGAKMISATWCIFYMQNLKPS